MSDALLLQLAGEHGRPRIPNAVDGFQPGGCRQQLVVIGEIAAGSHQHHDPPLGVADGQRAHGDGLARAGRAGPVARLKQRFWLVAGLEGAPPLGAVVVGQVEFPQIALQIAGIDIVRHPITVLVYRQGG